MPKSCGRRGLDCSEGAKRALDAVTPSLWFAPPMTVGPGEAQQGVQSAPAGPPWPPTPSGTSFPSVEEPIVDGIGGYRLRPERHLWGAHLAE